MSSASAANASSAKPKSKSRVSELFFSKRRPRLRGIPVEWERPEGEEAFAKFIDQEGFVSTKFWTADDITQYPIIWQDLEDLEEHLLPTFFQFSQKSKYYQNQFYLYQWIFIIGAFSTTVLGALASIYYVSDPLAEPGRQAIQQMFSWLTAIVGAVTAFITALSNRGEPQKRWGKTRRLAEELRMTYFQYLSHLPPFDKPDRVQKLRETVINIRVKEQENV